MARRRRLRTLLAGGVAVAAAVAGGVAYAYWSAGGAGTATAYTDTLPTGGTPTATVTGGTTVTVSFARAVTPGGQDVTSYQVRRYPTASGGTASATFTCAWPSPGSLSCVETGVPAGVWYYTDTPLAGTSWVGAESPRSNAATTDSTPPTVSVSSITPPPNGNGYQNSSPVTVGLSATDNVAGSGVASITYWVDAGTHTTVTSATAPVSVAGDGSHTVSYFATDSAGNVSATGTQTVRIDTVAPAGATITSYPNPVNLANRASVAVSGTAEADSTVMLTITDVGNVHAVTRTATADGAGSWTVTGVDVTALNDGTITYRATATDAAGNTGPAGTATASKDTVPPTVAVTAITNPVNSGNVGSATASGTISGGTVVLTVSDGTHTVTPPVTTNGSTWSVGPVNLATLTDGAITYTATATDPAGNTATASQAATKDTAAPTVTGLAVGPAANPSTGLVSLGTVTNLEGHLVTTAQGSYSFTATLRYAVNGGQSVVTATLGSLNPGGAAMGTTGSSQFTWTPSSGNTDLATNPISGSVSQTAVPF